jgi:hypothetical protein
MSRTKTPLHASPIICKDCNARLGMRDLEGNILLTVGDRDPERCIYPRIPDAPAIQCPRVKAALVRHSTLNHLR